MLFEATAPFVNGRYFLATAGLKESLLYRARVRVRLALGPGLGLG